MPQIDGDKKLRRTIKLYGVEGDTVITLSAQGIEFKAKGTKLGVFAHWQHIADAAMMPQNVPSKFHKAPLAFLAWQAEQFTKRKAKRLEKQLREEAKLKGGK